MRILALCLLFFIQLQAYETFVLTNHFKKEFATKYVYYTYETKKGLKAHEVNQKEDLKPIKESYYGLSPNAFWTRLEIENISFKPQEVVIYNERTRLNEVDVFIFKDNNLMKTHRLGDLIPQAQKQTQSRFPLFKYNFKPNEKITVITRINNNVVYELSWTVQSLQSFMKEETSFMLGWGLLAGILILAFAFNIFMFKIHQQKGYLIIAINCIVFLLFQYAGNGIFYQMDLGFPLNIYVTVYLAGFIVMTICLILFPYYFFNTKENYPKLAQLIYILLGIYAVIFLKLLFAQYITGDIFFEAVTFLAVMSIINSTTLLAIGIYMYMQKETGSVYYILGQGLVALGFIVFVLSILSVFQYDTQKNHLIIITFVIDLTFLFFAQYLRTKEKQAMLNKNKEILMDQSRFSSIGQSVGNIIHQWKHPLAQLGSSVTLLEATATHSKERLEKTVVSQLPFINNAINLMQKTMDEFSNFYGNKATAEEFNVYESILEVLSILKSKSILNNVLIKVDINHDLNIKSYKHIFTNIMIILIDNSLNAFNKKDENFIHISMQVHEGKAILHYQDNAGGIQIFPLESVFEYYVSSHSHEESQGLGLPILKMLVEERLRGKVHVKNTHIGVIFEITMKLEK